MFWRILGGDLEVPGGSSGSIEALGSSIISISNGSLEVPGSRSSNSMRLVDDGSGGSMGGAAQQQHRCEDERYQQ